MFADGGYAGQAEGGAGTLVEWTIQIIKRSHAAKGFLVLPRRRGAERIFACLGRCRRLAKDREATIASAISWAIIAPSE